MNLSSVRKLSVNGIESMVFVKPGVVIAPDMNRLWLDLLDWPRGLHLDLRLWEKHLCRWWRKGMVVVLHFCWQKGLLLVPGSVRRAGKYHRCQPPQQLPSRNSRVKCL